MLRSSGSRWAPTMEIDRRQRHSTGVCSVPLTTAGLRSMQDRALHYYFRYPTMINMGTIPVLYTG